MNRTKITREEAITISIELWTELAETGGDWQEKVNWSGWERYGEMSSSCALCQYARGACRECPYQQKYGTCFKNDKMPLRRWELAHLPATRRKYARLGVEQLKALLED